MRFVTYTADAAAGQHVGLLSGDRVINLAAAAASLGLAPCHDDMAGCIADSERTLETARAVLARMGGDAAAGVPLSSVRLRAPIVPARNVVCVGLNYAEHVAESKSVAGTDAPQHPVYFTKPPTCVIGPEDEIPWHAKVSTAIDWEAELAVVIGRRGRDIAEADALSYVFGYTVANDVTARDLQGRHQQWYKGKGLDGFCPLGPAIVTPDEAGDAQALDIALRVNGETKQSSNTRFMIFSIARLIADWSAGMTILPGDVLLTGTPSGVGIGRKPPEFLHPGDVVEAEGGGIGLLRNPVGGA